MKKARIVIVSLVALLMASASLSAQGKWGADSAECIKYLSYYKEYFKQKSYDDAIPNWRKAYQLCPATASQNMLIDGTTLVRRLIQQSKNAQARAALVDTLLTLHDTRAEYYPQYAVTALNNKGLDMANYLKNNVDKLYKGYEGIISANLEQTKSNIFLFDLQSAIELYQQSGIDAEAVINVYQRNMDLIGKAVAKNDVEAEQNEKIKTDMGSIFASSKIASCDNIVELFEPRLAADPENLDLATNIVKIMSITEDCSSNDLYLKAVTTMNNLAPSASSAYYLYKLHSARGNVQDAISYLNNAIAAEDSDAAQDADWTYELATFCFKNGQTAKAYEYASSVPAMSEALAGKAYFLLGNIWGSTRCGGNDIETRAPYWVACDFMNKAKNADPSLADEANRYISQYSTYFPQSADAFMYDLSNGQSYTVVCGGMRATTTVRTNK